MSERKPFSPVAENGRTTLKDVDTMAVPWAESFESPIAISVEHEVTYLVRHKVTKASFDHLTAYK